MNAMTEFSAEERQVLGDMVARFIDWCAQLQCGVDVVTPLFKVPAA